MPATTCGRSSAIWWPAGTTLLLTTQYLDEADELADDIVVFDHGKVIAQGTADELKDTIGGDVVEFTVADPEARGPSRSRPSACSPTPIPRSTTTEPSRCGSAIAAPTVLIEVVRRLDASRNHRRTASPCDGPRSTTCSSR